MKKITNDKLANEKLKLNRQTIAVLSTLQLGEIVGGFGNPSLSARQRTCE